MSKLEALKNWFKGHEGAVVAFSGGVDSSLVLYVSNLVLGNKTIGLISNSESLKSRDFKVAQEFCRLNQIELEVIRTRELKDPNYTSNPANRCFFCKNHLYEAMLEIIAEKYPGYTVLNGTNLDDLGDYRPGLEAAKNHRIRSPLAELGFNKHDVVKTAVDLGLSTAYKPPSPCLSSRIPYGVEVNNERLRQIEEAEYILNDFGFSSVRARYRGKTVSIEVPTMDIPLLENHFGPISDKIRNLGFSNIEIDREGFVSGKLNRVLDEE